MKIKINTKRLRIVFWATVGILLVFSFIPRGYAQSPDAPSEYPYTKKFILSSYYSPLPGQRYYFRGTYERDISLNGRGTNGADGTQVYPGMIAAPPGIPFGTKMQIPGIGVTTVHDRGGAIKNNRLDVWMGRGEEGLSRALGWGMRTLEVTVFGPDQNIPDHIDWSDVPSADLSRFLVQTEHFVFDLGEEDEGPEVVELQRFLKRLGYFDRNPTGYFGVETVNAVKQFQFKEQVIDREDDPGAGNFGPKSRMALEKILKQKKEEALAKLPAAPLKPGDTGEAVNQLQQALIEYRFLNKVEASYDVVVVDALVRFQMDISAIKDKNGFGAGYFGKKTRDALAKFISDAWTPFTSLGVSQVVSAGRPLLVKDLQKGSSGGDVFLLQEELKRLHFFGLEPTGNFGMMTEHAVFKFQQAFSIVADTNDSAAGIVGPKTRERLNAFAEARTSQTKTIAKTTEQRQMVVDRIQAERELIAKLSRNTAFSSELTYGMRHTDVSRLQSILKRLGFFPGRLTTEYFGDITKQSLMAFQKDHGLSPSGDLDAATRKLLNQIVTVAVTESRQSS